MRPLCVDVDGTLIRTDLLWESLWSAVGRRPWTALLIPFWILRGKCYLKEKAAEHGAIDPSALPYCQPFLDYLKQQRAQHRPLYLATGCAAPIARSIAEHLGIFDGAFSTENGVNCTGTRKLQMLTERFGARNFDYAGNARVDLPIWKGAGSALLINAPHSLIPAVKVAGVDIEFRVPRPSPWRALLRQLRIHQWTKNLLVFGAVFLSHRWSDWSRIAACIQAFIAFSLAASSVYMLNDLLDLQSDRLNPSKRDRPFASGELPLWVGTLLSPMLSATALILGLLISPNFAAVLIAYIGFSIFYSLDAKRRIILDVIVLSGLYSVRLYAGGEAAHIQISTWTFAYTSFVFFSLALLKRYSELLDPSRATKRRGYEHRDAAMLSILGCASGLLAALPLALYAGSPEVRLLYQRPHLLWLLCGIHIYWISRTWIFAHRGAVGEDPVWFALRDRGTYFIAACALIILFLAT